MSIPSSVNEKHKCSWLTRAVTMVALLLVVAVACYGILLLLLSPSLPLTFQLLLGRNTFLFLTPPPLRNNHIHKDHTCNGDAACPGAVVAVETPASLAVVNAESTPQLLRDDPIEIDRSMGSLTYLDGTTEWVVASPDYQPLRGKSLPAVVPGDLITDLQKARIIGDPYYELNWIHNSSVWNNHTWVYRRNFTVPYTAPSPTGTEKTTRPPEPARATESAAH